MHVQAVEEIARSMVEQAAEAAEAAAKEATMWRERAQAQTNKMAQLEQKVHQTKGPYVPTCPLMCVGYPMSTAYAILQIASIHTL
jgi:hypothetical protein